MKARHVEFILFLIFVTKVTGRHQYDSDLLKQLNIGTNNQNPLIVVVNAKTQSQMTKDSDFNDLYITGADGYSDNNNFVYEEEAKEQAKHLLYTYLLRSGDPENPDEDKKLALRAVLRARCKAVVQCNKKCAREQPKKKYCPKNCKAVFDELNLCEPPKKIKKNSCDDSDECGKKVNSCEDGSDECRNKCEDSDECGNGKRGRTMRPKWRF